MNYIMSAPPHPRSSVQMQKERDISPEEEEEELENR